MLYVRFRHGDRESYGVLDGERITPVEGDLFGEHKTTGEEVVLSEVVLLAPVPRPGKILAAAVNYQSHAPSGSAITKQ